MRYGFWLPVFGGWLRNVDDEQMEASWEYVRDLTQRAEKIGYDLTLIAELNLNDIKGIEAPSLDAWSTTAALAAVTERLELMVAVRPTFHNPALLAKQAASIDVMSHGRLTLMSSRAGGRTRRPSTAFTLTSTMTAMRGHRSGWMLWMDAGSSRGSITKARTTTCVTMCCHQSRRASRGRRSMRVASRMREESDRGQVRCLPDAR